MNSIILMYKKGKMEGIAVMFSLTVGKSYAFKGMSG